MRSYKNKKVWVVWWCAAACVSYSMRYLEPSRLSKQVPAPRIVLATIIRSITTGDKQNKQKIERLFSLSVCGALTTCTHASHRQEYREDACRGCCFWNPTRNTVWSVIGRLGIQKLHSLAVSDYRCCNSGPDILCHVNYVCEYYESGWQTVAFFKWANKHDRWRITRCDRTKCTPFGIESDNSRQQ